MTKHPHEMRQGGQIWRLHHEGSGLPQIDNEERMIVVVISRPDGTELAVFVKRRADGIIDGGEERRREADGQGKREEHGPG